MVDLFVEYTVVVFRNKVTTTVQVEFELDLCLYGGDTECEKEQTYELLIPLPKDDPATSEVNEGVFQANTSYKVVLTVYGFERIVVKTEITPWTVDPTSINVGQDE